jgi:hypothetical protein
MEWRFHKSISIAKGLRLNLGKRGASISVGGRGLHFTTGTSGSSVSASIPGTGISYTEKLGSHHASHSRGHGSQKSGGFGLVFLMLIGLGLLAVAFWAYSAGSPESQDRYGNETQSRPIER